MTRYVLGRAERQFVCHFHFVGWSCISLGAHLDFAGPNIELHVPFGFFRIGWQGVWRWRDPITIGKSYQHPANIEVRKF